MTKVQRDVLLKAFRLLRAGAAEGERLTNEAALSPKNIAKLLEHVAATVRISQEIETALQMHVGASALLESITTREDPKQRNGLRLLKGGAK